MPGIHHVTAIAGSAARNLDFYTRTLGLRLVKKTVNFDDPDTYHLYFGDRNGSPGTILTFFPWAHAARGRNGTGLTETTSFRVPEASLGYWSTRFAEQGVALNPIAVRFDQSVLTFTDPDGMSLALVGVPGAEAEEAWHGGDVPPAHAIRGLHGVTLLVSNADTTAAVLTDVLGFTQCAKDGAVTRFEAAGTARGAVVDIHEDAGLAEGRMGRGSVHHIAFRAEDDAEQAEMRRKLADKHRLRATEQMDRNYFRSIYFREPGGIIFEIATDQPGFAVDEAIEHLGQALKLPPFLESRRAQIEARLPSLKVVS